MTDKRLQEIAHALWLEIINQTVTQNMVLAALRRAKHEARAEAFEEAAKSWADSFWSGWDFQSRGPSRLRDKAAAERSLAAREVKENGK